MKFDKFKSIDMPDIKVDPDFEYVRKLNNLPTARKNGRTLATLGTVAAAIVIIVGVSIWALIGRGVRYNYGHYGGDATLYAADGADMSSGVVLDTNEGEAVLRWILNYDDLPFFDKNQPPSVVEMLDFYHNLVAHERDASYEGKLINEVALKYFGVTYPLDEARSYQNSGSMNSGYEKYQTEYEPEVKRAMQYDMGDGKYNYVINYTLKDTAYILSYIAADKKSDPERYILHTTDKPLKKDYTDEKAFYLLQDKVFSDPNVKPDWLWLNVGDVYKITDTLYSIRFTFEHVDRYDINKPTFALDREHYPDFFEYVDGELVISENQNRKSEGEIVLKDYTFIEGATDKKTKKAFAQYVSKYGLVSLPEFDGKRIYANELSPENENIEFEITYYYGASTTYNERYMEIWFASGGKEYKVGFIEVGGGGYEIEYLLFKKENKLYTGNEQTTTMQYENLVKNFKPYSFKATEIEGNIPENLLLGQSMGIETPNIDFEMIIPYDDGPLKEMPEEYYKELEHIKEHGGSEEDVRKYYETMNESTLLWLRSQNNYAPLEDVYRLVEMFVNLIPYDVPKMRLSNYMCLERYYKNRYGYRYYTDKFTEDELLELKERDIVPNDIDYLLKKLGSPEKVLKASDKRIKSILTDYYNQKYVDAFGKEYK